MDSEPELSNALSVPGEPTGATPGSEWKIRIMTERAARGEPLFHPLDGPWCGAPPMSLASPGWWPLAPMVASAAEQLDASAADFHGEAADDPKAPAAITTLEYAGQTGGLG